MSTACLLSPADSTYDVSVMPEPPQTKTELIQFRTTLEFKAILKVVSHEFGGSQTAALEWCVRDYFKRNRMRLPSGASLTAETKHAYDASPAPAADSADSADTDK